MKKQWVMRAIDRDYVPSFAETLSISPITAAVLLGRGVADPSQARQWMSASQATWHDPFLLPDMERAVDRVNKAIQAKERICFYGDYDVDGISATSLHLSFFRGEGAEAEVYIPDRQSEGYGLNEQAIRHLASNGVKVLLTADCGTTSHHEVEVANHLGLDVIVTDHHQIQEHFPPALAFLNPQRADSQYPFQGLCSGGIAYKFVEAYALKYGCHARPVQEYRDLVALSSIADVVPLLDENRYLVREGLGLLTNGTRCGVRALKQCLGITGPCTASTVGFRLAPVINAAGRLAHARLGVKLLTTDSDIEALQLAKQLEGLNRERRQIEQDMFHEAVALVQHRSSPSAIVVGVQGWHVGVIGIVASRLVERYHKPAVVIAFDSQGVGKGSLRSIPGIDVCQALADCRDSVVGFGGHPAAAGVTLHLDQLERFNEKFCDAVASRMTADHSVPILDVDAHVQLRDVHPLLVRELEQLHPYGMGNPEPTLMAEGLTVLEKRVVGDNHLKVVVRQSQSVPIEGIGFRMGEFGDMLDQTRQQVDMAFIPEVSRWKGYDRMQLRIRDLRISQSV
ncbi:MAG: single-stranded-DNA-specific exonuclease RecJ [Nitrospirota bacterium]|nr:single-stranded-DNA-specific exonuclease RecJ [Nitrospirota bacterium]